MNVAVAPHNGFNNLYFINNTDGMFLLRRFPERLPAPCPFVPGSRDILEKTLRCVHETFTTSAGDRTIQSWQKWASEIAPADDHVSNYLAGLSTAADSLHIPLRFFFIGMMRYDPPPHVRAVAKRRTLGQESDLPLYRAGG